MPLQTIDGMLFYGQHGVFEQEKLGINSFKVSVQLNWKNIQTEPEFVRFLVKQVMDQPTPLLEELVGKIALSLLAHLVDDTEEKREQLKMLTVRVEKSHPALGMAAAASFSEITLLEKDKFKPEVWTCGLKALRLWWQNNKTDVGEWLLFNMEVQIKAPHGDLEKPYLLEQFFDYSILAQAAKMVLAKKPKSPTQILKEVERTAQRLSTQMQSLAVAITQQTAPFSGWIASVGSEEANTYLKKCPRCTQNLLCYNTEECWCKGLRISQRTADLLQQRYDKSCLCATCLAQFANP